MKFLFVLDNLRDDCGANVNIAMKISNAMRKKGNNVYAIVRENIDNSISHGHVKSFDKVITVEDNCYNALFSLYKGKNWITRNNFYKLKEYLKRPYLFLNWVDWKLLKDGSLKKKYKKEIQKIDQEHEIYAVIGFSQPQWTEEVVCCSKVKAHKGIFKLDPYVYHAMYRENKTEKRRKEQQKIIDEMDIVFITELMERDLIKHNWKIDSKKKCIYQFPGIVVDDRFNLQKKGGSDDSINVFFVGRLYEDIRNPEFIFKLFLKLPDNFILHIIGSGAENTVNIYKLKLFDRLILHGPVSVEVANDFMMNADILLNIGNTIENQLPSKVFDYINTGRPILNCCKLKNCPSLMYLRNYPLAYSFFEEDGISDLLISEIEKFSINSRNQNVDIDLIMNNYKECTDSYVADMIIKKFSEVS